MEKSKPIRAAGIGELLFVIIAAVLALALAATDAFNARPRLISGTAQAQSR